MSDEGVKQVIGRSVVDEEFRTLLFAKPAEALVEFDLTDEERTQLQNVTRDQFDNVSSEVEERVSRAHCATGAHYKMASLSARKSGANVNP